MTISWRYVIVVLVCLSSSALAARGECDSTSVGDGEWIKHTIGEQDAVMYVATADMDQDGDLDVIATSNTQRPDYLSEIAWYRNNDYGRSWDKFVIWNTSCLPIEGATGVAAADIDRDGRVEVVVAASRPDSSGGEVHLLSPFRRPTGWWYKVVLQASSSEGYWKVYTHDVNDDGFEDVIAGGTDSAKILINPRFFPQLIPWRVESLPEGTGTSIFLADIGGDGAVDVLNSNYYAQRISWTTLQNDDGDLEFNDHIIAEDIVAAFDINTLDIDADGHNDVIVSALMQPGIQAFFAPQEVGGSWTTGWIRDDYSATDIYAADVNLDGVTDVAAVSFGNSGLGVPGSIAWFEKVETGDADEGEWITHYIDNETIRLPADFELRDVDADGDLDVVTGSLADDDVLWYENPR